MAWLKIIELANYGGRWHDQGSVAGRRWIAAELLQPVPKFHQLHGTRELGHGPAFVLSQLHIILLIRVKIDAQTTAEKKGYKKLVVTRFNHGPMTTSDYGIVEFFIFFRIKGRTQIPCPGGNCPGRLG